MASNRFEPPNEPHPILTSSLQQWVVSLISPGALEFEMEKNDIKLIFSGTLLKGA